jgi:hypothetical protein
MFYGVFVNTMRKNTEPFIRFIGIITWFVVVLAGTATQFVLKPMLNPLVCDCNVQPV